MPIRAASASTDILGNIRFLRQIGTANVTSSFCVLDFSQKEAKKERKEGVGKSGVKNENERKRQQSNTYYLTLGDFLLLISELYPALPCAL